MSQILISCFTSLFKIKKSLSKRFFILYNPVKFRLLGINLGCKSKLFHSIYIDKNPSSIITIGDYVTIRSGNAYNPLCRNIKSYLCSERPNSVISIGNHTGLSSCCIWAKERITIGNYVNIGADTIILDSDAHSLNWQHRASPDMVSSIESLDSHNAKCAPITINDNVLIGTRCIILKGVTIGARSIIAAGSIVTKDIPSDCIAAGNPAVVIKKI